MSKKTRWWSSHSLRLAVAAMFGQAASAVAPIEGLLLIKGRERSRAEKRRISYKRADPAKALVLRPSLYALNHCSPRSLSIFNACKRHISGVVHSRASLEAIMSLSSSAPGPGPQKMRFVVERKTRGYWSACEKQGLIEGVFATQREALRFALRHVRPRAAPSEGTR